MNNLFWFNPIPGIFLKLSDRPVRLKAGLVTFFAGLSISVFSAASPATATVITFNEFSQGTSVTNQYANVGALFSVSGATPAVIVDIGGTGPIGDADVADNANINPPTGTSSPPNGLRINGGQPFDDILRVDFVDPANSAVPADMNSVSFNFVSDVAGIGSITAFDSLDNMVDVATSVLGGSSNDSFQAFETLTVTGPAIRYVKIDGFADVIIDDLIFTSRQVSGELPEPGTLGLFVFGFMALEFARRKSRNPSPVPE